MSDTKLRDLERRWKETGTVEDEAAYLLERVRVGDLSRERLELAAYCGHMGAAKALPIALDRSPERGRAWVEDLRRRFGVDVGFRATLLLLAGTTPQGLSGHSLRSAKAVMDAALNALNGDCSRVEELSAGADELTHGLLEERPGVQHWLRATVHFALSVYHHMRPDWAGIDDPLSTLPDDLPSGVRLTMTQWALAAP